MRDDPDPTKWALQWSDNGCSHYELAVGPHSLWPSGFLQVLLTPIHGGWRVESGALCVELPALSTADARAQAEALARGWLGRALRLLERHR